MSRPAMPPVLLAATALAACASEPLFIPGTAAPPPSAFAAARLLPVPEKVAPPGPPAAPAPAVAALPGDAVPPASPATREPSRPLARVEAANRSAAREPTRHGYVNAAQVYDWTDGALYRLYTAPEQVSEIALQPGEQLIAVAAGDTVRWVIGDTASGTGAARRTHVLVKPTAPGLRTNLVITTDRRVYHIALESSAGPAMASISWAYPADALLALDRGGDPGVPGEGAGGLAVESLNFAYAIDGDDPPWRPLRAFDDGTQVFIEFPPRLSTDEAPPLFVAGKSGRPELVNYRVRGRFYVVDRLFAAAELRLGEKRQAVVRIRAVRPEADGTNR